MSVTGSDNGEQEGERSRRLPLPVRYDEKHNIQRIFFRELFWFVVMAGSWFVVWYMPGLLQHYY